MPEASWPFRWAMGGNIKQTVQGKTLRSAVEQMREQLQSLEAAQARFVARRSVLEQGSKIDQPAPERLPLREQLQRLEAVQARYAESGAVAQGDQESWRNAARFGYMVRGRGVKR